MKKKIENIPSLLLILILGSCNMPGTKAPEPDGETSTAIPKPATAAPIAIPEPLPSGYVDLLQGKIGAGEWTLEEGLVTLLKIFAGEIQSSQAGLGEGVLQAEGTGVLILAGEYLQTGTDQLVKDEVIRLVNIIVPSQEALDQYSIPEEQASSRSPGLAAPARQDLEDCKSLWSDGFPDMRTPSFVCFLVGEQIIANNAYRVYYPKAWHGDASRDAYYTATQVAILDSINAYQNFGSFGPIYFVFTTLDASDGVDTAAETFWESFKPTSEACPVIIYPSAMGSSEDDLVFFKQLIAHEIFHCFQAWHLKAQGVGAGLNSTNWWVEGTAEYFSNLVYPAANFEYDFEENFDIYSTVKPLTNLSYENFAFFQFLGNRIGPEGIIAMLRSMPTTPGLDLQVAALAAVPGMEATFEEFVRSLLDHTLLDSDRNRTVSIQEPTDIFTFTDIASWDITSRPFVVARYIIEFESKKTYAVETLVEGTGHSGWRASGDVGNWGPVPTSIGGCENLESFLYVISTTPGTLRTGTIATTMVTEAPCDECVIGKWEATNDSVLYYMQSVVSRGGDNVPTVESATGTMFLEFRGNGLGYGGYRNLKVYETGVGGTEGTDTITTFEGFSSGPYTADGSDLIGLSGTTDILVTVEILVNGVSFGSTNIPLRPEDFPVSSTLSTRYTCGGDTLFTWPPVEGITEPIMYERIRP